tara:strand:+ start:428 stop:679 length:252 start_codon:yes stop_codon:yes gene_type:complete
MNTQNTITETMENQITKTFNVKEIKSNVGGYTYIMENNYSVYIDLSDYEATWTVYDNSNEELDWGVYSEETIVNELSFYLNQK